MPEGRGCDAGEQAGSSDGHGTAGFHLLQRQGGTLIRAPRLLHVTAPCSEVLQMWATRPIFGLTAQGSRLDTAV
jgi:hypothetical protein